MSSWFNYRFHDEEGNVVFLRGKENIDEHIASGKYSQRLEIAYRFKGNEKQIYQTKLYWVNWIILSINLKRNLQRKAKLF